ncbi:MAG: hypothetical protein Q8L86_12560 [Vicinamibacterales bacterium]|nr:hypothetical protein [Vicinamibacterales bacterium]
MSLTIFGIFTAVAGTALVQLGFSEVCSNEIIANLPAAVGGAIAYYGRWRQGDVTLFGVRKESY